MICTHAKFFWFLKSIIFIFIIFIPMKTSIYQISFGLLIILFLTYLFYYKKTDALKKLFLLYKDIFFGFFLIVLSMLVSNIIGQFTTIESWLALIQYIIRYFLFFWILIFFYAENIISKQFILIAIFTALFIQGIDGIYQILFGVDIIKANIGSLTEGLSGATDNRNVFGFFMAIGASICFAILFSNKIKESKNNIYFFLIYSNLLFFVFNLLFSYSRSAWLFYSIFILLVILGNRKQFSFRNVIILLLILGFIGVIFLSFSTLSVRFVELIAMNSSQRDLIWIDAIRLIKENPLFGYGLMTFKQIASQPIHTMHNSLFEIILFLGLFGFIVFTNLLFIILKEILKNKNSIHFAFFFAFLIVTQFDHSVIKGITSLSSLSIFSFFIFSDRLKQGKSIPL